MADEGPTHRDEVPVAFHATCVRPSTGDFAAWADRRPDLARDIRADAEVLLAAAQQRHLRPEPSEALLARTRSCDFDAIQAAHARATKIEAAPRLADRMTARLTEIVATEVGAVHYRGPWIVDVGVSKIAVRPHRIVEHPSGAITVLIVGARRRDQTHIAELAAALSIGARRRAEGCRL